MSVTLTFVGKDRKDLMDRVGAFMAAGFASSETATPRAAKTPKAAKPPVVEEDEEDADFSDTEAEEEEEAVEEEEAEEEEEAPTKTEVIAALNAHSKKFDPAVTLKLLQKKYSVKSVKELKETQYAAVIKTFALKK